MADIQKRAEQFDKAVSWAERVHNVLKYMGVAGRVEGVLGLGVTLIWAAVVRTIGHMPFWVSVPAGLVVAVLVLNFVAAVRRVLALRGIKTLDIQQLGRDCVQLRADMFEWLVGRQDAAPERMEIPTGDPEAVHKAMHGEWAKGVKHSQQTSARLAEKFAARVVANCHLLQISGIKPPDLWGFDHNAGAIAAYIGAVGELLERGLLEEARKMDPTMIRSMHFYFG